MRCDLIALAEEPRSAAPRPAGSPRRCWRARPAASIAACCVHRGLLAEIIDHLERRARADGAQRRMSDDDRYLILEAGAARCSAADAGAADAAAQSYRLAFAARHALRIGGRTGWRGARSD